MGVYAIHDGIRKKNTLFDAFLLIGKLLGSAFV